MGADRIPKIVSCGQTGADRVPLGWAFGGTRGSFKKGSRILMLQNLAKRPRKWKTSAREWVGSGGTPRIGTPRFCPLREIPVFDARREGFRARTSGVARVPSYPTARLQREEYRLRLKRITPIRQPPIGVNIRR